MVQVGYRWPDDAPRKVRVSDSDDAIGPEDASPFVGRELGGLLHGAAFVETTPGARAEVEAGIEVVARTGESQAIYFGAPELRAYAIARGLATAAELETATRAWKVWGTTSGAFWARFTCFATGRKP